MVLRAANPVGRWQIGGRHGLVASAIESMVSGRPLKIYGDDKNVRDYFDADDFAKFMVDVMVPISSGLARTIFRQSVGRTELEVMDLVERHIRALLVRSKFIVGPLISGTLY